MLLSLPKKYCFILLISYTYDFELANLIIVNACMIQYRGRGGEKKKIKYRDPLFKPTWWLEEEWSWEAAVNFKEKKYYTGPETLTEFLKRSRSTSVTRSRSRSRSPLRQASRSRSTSRSESSSRSPTPTKVSFGRRKSPEEITAGRGQPPAGVMTRSRSRQQLNLN